MKRHWRLLLSSVLTATLVGLGSVGTARADGRDGDDDARIAGHETGDGVEAGFEHEGAPPVIFDTDMDFDDTAALAYIAQEHIQGRVNLRAVTITNNGGGSPGQAIQHARCILERFGLSNIPVADATYNLPHHFAAQLRGAVSAVLGGMTAGCTASDAPSVESAGQLMADVIAHTAGRISIINVGPMTNIQDAFHILHNRYGLPAGWFVHRLVVMGGAFDVPGDLCCGLEQTYDNTQDLNTWGDPAAAQEVFHAVLPGALTINPLDATQYVPVTQDFVARIAADHTTDEADYVNDLLHNPIIQFGISLHAFYWWDPLATVIATRGNVARYHWERVNVIVPEGPSSGRTVIAPDGAWARVAYFADAAAFEDTFINVLNGRQR